MNKETSYTALYHEIVYGRLKDVEPSGKRALIALSILTWVLMAIVIAINLESWLLLIGVGIVINLVFVAGAFIPWLIFVIYLGSRNAFADVNSLTAKLLVGLRSPQTGQRGLTIEDLNYLKSVALVEQSAADWRGNFINLIIVGLIFGTVFNLINAGPEISEMRDAAQSAGEAPVTLNVPNFDWAPPDWLSSTFDSISIVFWSVAILVVLLQLIRYFGDFIISEGPNRRLQLACLEAEAVLKREELIECEPPALAQRRRLARLLGFRLEGTFIHTLKTPLYTDEEERAWHLVPVARPRFSLSWWFHEWSLQYFKKQRIKKHAKGRSDSQPDQDDGEAQRQYPEAANADQEE